MTYWKRFSHVVLAVALAVLPTVAPLATLSAAPQASGQQAAVTKPPDIAASLAAIETAIDEKRKELGIPGVSLVIVRDDKVIYMKGLGVKDFERKLPVTPDTLFAIGSASKAFTALAAVLSADEGKLSLEDSPKKFLPYFKLRDPDADSRITIRDLLSHRSGLNRTDLAMATNLLNREELIKVAGMAKPAAKLGEKFQYQNVMYAAAGEVVARAQNSSWDEVITNRVFKPLEMKATDTTVAAMQHSPDYSLGYDYNATTKETRRLPMREIPAAAPAGAINSNARDMAQWLRFMLAGGVVNGQRIVSEKGFNELITKQINVAGSIDYGMGWFLRQWDGRKVVEHGGNIDGFNSQVAMLPEQKLGFVLLTNVTASPLVNFAMTTIWSNLVGLSKGSRETEKTVSGPTVDPKTEAGTYKLVEAGIDFEVAMKDGKLVLTVPGQPPYPLENLGGRHYKLSDPAPPGFFATFRPVNGKETETEMYLEQPQGNVVVRKVTPADSAAADPSAKAAEEYSGPLKEMLGHYEKEQAQGTIEVGVNNGKVSLIVAGQSPYPLVAKEKDRLISPSLPDAYWVDVKRDAEGKVSGVVINQPEGRFPFRRIVATKVTISVDDLIARMIAAYGGEENLRKRKSSVTTIAVDLESQGLQGEGVITAKAPNMTGSSMTLTALGKTIGTIVNYFDGLNGGQTLSFAPEEVYTGKRLADVKLASNFYGVLEWKKAFKTITIKRISKVGDEDAYVVEKVPETGNTVTDYISTKSFLLLRRDTIVSNETSGIEIPQTENYSDYRPVAGVMIAFKTLGNNIANGDVVVSVKDVKFDVDIPDSVFRKPAKK
jgi:CubicO group peptidase (beta-lactamase class C family)